MPLSDPALPYGLRDVKVTPINSDGSLGASVDLPVAQTLSFSEAEEFEELRGDDRLVAVHGQGPTIEWDLEAGGISLDAWKVLTGGTVTDTGVTPTQIKEFTKKTNQSRPYFRIEGQSINDVDGDTHVVIYKAKVTENLEGEFADGTFFITSCSGQGLGDADEKLYTITWNETTTPIDAAPAPSTGQNEIQQIISNGASGDWDLDFDGQTASDIPWNASPAELQVALESLSNVGVGDVHVTGAAGNWFVEFTGNLAVANVPQIEVDGADLTPSSIAVLTVQPGVAPE